MRYRVQEPDVLPSEMLPRHFFDSFEGKFLLHTRREVDDVGIGDAGLTTLTVDQLKLSVVNVADIFGNLLAEESTLNCTLINPDDRAPSLQSFDFEDGGGNNYLVTTRFSMTMNISKFSCSDFNSIKRSLA